MAAGDVLMLDQLNDDAVPGVTPPFDTLEVSTKFTENGGTQTSRSMGTRAQQQYVKVKRVVDAYPIDSIKNLGSLFKAVWDQEFIPLGALAPDLKKEKLSFHDVENKIVDAGAVAIIYGSASGLTSEGNQALSQDTDGVRNSAEAGDQFGFALATGNFDQDGFIDLAVGVPGEDALSGPRDAGAVNVMLRSVGVRNAPRSPGLGPSFGVRCGPS